MKYFCISIALFLFVLAFDTTVRAAACDEEPIHGVYYTSSFCWSNTSPYTDGSIGSIRNDTKRLQRALDKAVGKLVFDEAGYFINDDLVIKHSFLIIEGTGRGVINPNPGHSATPTPTPAPGSTPYPGPGASPTADDPYLNKSTRIVQTTTNKSVFKIGEDIYFISIRDLALIAESTTGTVGILIQGGPTASGYPSVANRSSIGFEFQNLTFNSFGKGIYVNAQHYGPGPSLPTYPDLTGVWQADHGRIDHAYFVDCKIGIHINSNNSGWSMNSLEFIVPLGDVMDSEDLGEDDPGNQTWAIYLQRSTYTNINLAIGNAHPDDDNDENEGEEPTGFIRVYKHGNVTIQNATDEFGFQYSYLIGTSDAEEGTLSMPVNLTNNVANNHVYFGNTGIVSTANQYGTENQGTHPARFDAYGASEIYSFGDSFCVLGTACVVGGDDYSNFKMHDTARLVMSSTKKGQLMAAPLDVAGPFGSGTPLFSVMATDYAPTLMRLGRTAYWFDFTRSEYTGALEIHGNQTCCNAIKFIVGTSTEVTVNTDGSVTYGSTAYSGLGSSTNGTVIYCSNCTKATPCASGGNGALAKRINSAWDCD